MIHLTLFNNLSTKEFLSAEDPSQPDAITTALYTKHALTTPYLMHQLLASSALQLSTACPASAQFYHDYATGLQQRALSLFNESHPNMDTNSGNCVTMYLFSALVGVHLLCDTLYYQRDSLEGFIDRFTYCLDLYRGVLTVADECLHLLRETELGPSLQLSHALEQSGLAAGPECDALWDMLSTFTTPASSLKAYRESVLYLQQVFATQNASSPQKIRISLVFGWAILVSSDYISLLRQRQPEALVIFAQYCVLLHRGRNLWIIGDGGRFLINSIAGHLGTEWQEWLKFPKAALQEDVPG